MKAIKKVVKVGTNSLMVIIPENVIKFFSIKEGDEIEFDISKKVTEPKSFDEFCLEFRKSIYKLYPEEIKSGKIYETKNGWVGLKFKKEVK